ncbi:unnamed protein product [Linum trigynum]|uniref:DNA helicase Pif1-like 2B domain-containing protein n=1 Tax=Linum trigynum TaxID=586398 RepID=A0AAV2GTY2_9ROSI
MLDENNELVRTFRRIRQDLQLSSTPNLRLRIFGIKSRNRQYDLPTSSDIAALTPGDFVADREDRDIIVDHRGEGLKLQTRIIFLKNDSQNTRPQSRSRRVLKLSRNMRLNDSQDNRNLVGCGMNFGEWILALGDGRLPTKSFMANTPSDWIEIPQILLIYVGKNPIESITNDIYDAFEEQHMSTDYLSGRAIVTPTNAVVTEVNDFMLQKIPGHCRCYYISDSMQLDTEVPQLFAETYPTEFLNALQFNGVPDHEIRLKVHTPIMLLRNLSPPNGLCNEDIPVNYTRNIVYSEAFTDIAPA